MCYAGTKKFIMLLAVVGLVACNNEDVFTGDGSGIIEGAEPSSLVLLADAPTLSSDAAGVGAGIGLTAIAKDDNNNVVPGAVVVFSTADSGEINVVNPAFTDENGRVEATLTTGGDQTNRTIRVNATSGGLRASVSVDVVGTTIAISGPTNTQFGVPTEFTVLLSDAAGNGIPRRTVEVTTEAENSLSANTLETDDFGQVRVEFTGTLAESSLTATGLGLSSSVPIAVSPDDFTINVRRLGEVDFLPIGANNVPELIVGQDYEIIAQWSRDGSAVEDGLTIDFGATRGNLSPAQDQTAGGAANTVLRSSEAGFSILTAGSQALSRPSARTNVEFVATDPTKIEVQASPANVPRNQSSEITAIVRDADNNLVKNVTVEFFLADQTTGTLSAPSAVTNSQGLARVTYAASSQPSATEGVAITGRVQGRPGVTDTTQLTVGGVAANIALGTGSEIISVDQSTYQLPFTIVVTDSGGNPVQDANVSLTLFETHYRKGTFGDSIECENEDLNQNDILDDDLFEDVNGNDRLDPGRRASVPSTVDLREDGSGQFFVTYAKTDGLFVTVEITASVRVAGTESTEKRKFLLTVAETDVDNLPGVSPFGTVLSCISPD